MNTRISALVSLVLTIILGLASRRFDIFPAVFEKYPGDALWAIAVFFALRVAFINLSPARNAIYAVVISFSVEFSQVCHSPWIDSVRSKRIGHLFLGNRFNPCDLLAYVLGVSLVLLADLLIRRNNQAAQST